MTPWWAVWSFQSAIVLIVALAISYGLLLRRSAVIVEHARLELAERGEKYLSFCDDAAEASQINFYLENAFNPWIAVVTSIFLWFALCIVIVNPNAGRLQLKSQEEHERISNLFTLSVFAANPLFGIIAAIEIAAVAAVALLVVGNVALIRRAVARILEVQAGRSSQRVHAH